MYPRSEVFNQSSRYSEAQPEQAKAKHRSRCSTSIHVKRRYCTSNRSSWLERGSFRVSRGVNVMTFGVLDNSQSTHFFFILALFRLNFKIALSSKTTGKRNHLVHFGYCHYVMKYLMRDMMNYHCLRVFRSRDRRIGKRSPGSSVCVVVVPCCAVFRSSAPSWRSFLFSD